MSVNSTETQNNQETKTVDPANNASAANGGANTQPQPTGEQRLSEAEYIAKLKVAEDKNKQWEAAHNSQAQKIQHYQTKLQQYETGGAAGSTGANNSNNNTNNNTNVDPTGGAAFSTDDSTRKIVREELYGLQTEQTIGNVKINLQNHIKQGFKPAASNVQLDQLLPVIDAEADRLRRDPAFEAEFGHLPVANQIVAAYDLASAGRLITLVKAGDGNPPAPKPNEQKFSSQSDYGGQTASSLSTGDVIAQKEQDLAQLKAGKPVDQNQIMKLDFELQKLRTKAAG